MVKHFFKSHFHRKTSNAGVVKKSEKDGSYPNVQAKIAILLCTYNGAQFLAKQLDSFQAQSHTNWEVWASDDGSEDDTYVILEAYQKKWPIGHLSINFGPAEGFSANFLSLIRKACIEADYYAFSDQDDVWEGCKLERAVRWLDSIPQNTPALYCSRTRIVNEENSQICLSPLFSKPPSFANALIESVGGGNTMVFNNAARLLLSEVKAAASIIPHDRLTYLVISGCGGKVFFDSHPTVRYRQHDGNQVGMKLTWVARLKYLRMLWKGHFRTTNYRNCEALREVQHKLTPENRKTLERFTKAKQMGLVLRLIQFKRSGIYRQTLFGNLGLIVAATFGKL